MTNFENLKEDIYCDAVCDVLTDVCNIHEESKDFFMDILEINGATMSEIAFAKYIIEEYVDLLEELIDEEFGIDEVVEIECNESCEDCPLFNK